MGPVVNQSTGSADALTGPNACGTAANSLPGFDPGNAHALGRCGYGPRQPLMVISPYSKQNYVDHTITDQTSVIRFVEDNWLNGKRIGSGSFDGIANSIEGMLNFNKAPNTNLYILDETSGEPVGVQSSSSAPVYSHR